ncbi:MAG TPA: DinB family protein [Chthonomonadaceae bacterium]|nr:DinB family protein [Chthonomonadaceae bacterium]
MRDTCLELLELTYYEAPFAFDGLADENVWKRPAPGLLSVGELAGHIAFWQAVKFAGEGGEPLPDPAKCRVISPLVDTKFAYYTTNLPASPSPQHLAMTAKQVCDELLRVHRESMAHFKSLNPDLATCPPGWPPYWTYAELLKYAVFHVSYHVGQMYSARHLLGESTPDN